MNTDERDIKLNDSRHLLHYNITNSNPDELAVKGTVIVFRASPRESFVTITDCPMSE